MEAKYGYPSDTQFSVGIEVSDEDEEQFKVYINPQHNSTFDVSIIISITSDLHYNSVRNLANEEELYQYFKKLNDIFIDDIKEELTKSLREYCNQIL